MCDRFVGRSVALLVLGSLYLDLHPFCLAIYLSCDGMPSIYREAGPVGGKKDELSLTRQGGKRLEVSEGDKGIVGRD